MVFLSFWKNNMKRGQVSRNLVVVFTAGIIFFSVFYWHKHQHSSWDASFYVVKVKSSRDGALQNLYYYRSSSKTPQPLVVSLHSWAGDYSQPDKKLSLLIKHKNWNYIHPDFRGPNNKPKSCCSEYVISDIDDAIIWAQSNLYTDPKRIYVIAGSGGGYVALCVWMKSNRKIRAFSIWNPITDLTAWYNESIQRKNSYKGDICRCTGSSAGSLDIPKAQERSPLFWNTSILNNKDSIVRIYAGLYDGTGVNPVPLTHALRMYNKILLDMKVKEQAAFVSDQEMKLLSQNKAMSFKVTEHLGVRNVYLHKKFQNVELIVFDGGHELLAEPAVEGL
jgi:pimeloyl-ACP methyl ester carboxylesterase